MYMSSIAHRQMHTCACARLRINPVRLHKYVTSRINMTPTSNQSFSYYKPNNET